MLLCRSVGTRMLIWAASSRCPEGHDYVLTKQYQPSQTPQGIVQPIQTTRRLVTCGRCNTGALCILFPNSAPTSMHNPFMSSVRVPMGCTTYQLRQLLQLYHGVPTRPDLLSTSVPQAVNLSALEKALLSEVGIPWRLY